jgi:cell division protein FtsW
MSIVTAMLVYGLVMVFSSSYPYSVLGADHPFYFIARQALWLGLGLIMMIAMARIPYTVWERWSVPLMGITVAALAVLLIFGIERFGSTRTFIGGSIQPSQPAKVIIIIYIANWLASKGDRIRSVSIGLIPFAVMLGVLTFLIVLQPSISTAVLIVITALIMFFIAGAAIPQLLAVGAIAAASFYLILHYSAYASTRVEKYLASIWNPLMSQEHQVRQSVQALSIGGPLGVGIGQGTAQQPGFVPMPWSDNIYAVIGEELGLLGTLLVILLFALLIWRGLRISMRCRDPFGMLLALGLTAMLAVQATINIGVVVAWIPPTGMPLPFFSYGGSAMLATMAAVGLLFSISRFGRGTGRVARPGTVTDDAGNKVDNHARDDLGRRYRRPRVSSTGRRSPTAPRTSPTYASRTRSGTANTPYDD